MSKDNTNRLINSVIYSKENIELDRRLTAKTKQSIKRFKKHNLEKEYQVAALKSYKVEHRCTKD